MRRTRTRSSDKSIPDILLAAFEIYLSELTPPDNDLRNFTIQATLNVKHRNDAEPATHTLQLLFAVQERGQEGQRCIASSSLYIMLTVDDSDHLLTSMIDVSMP